jgi:malate dehydrogenase
MRKKIAVIGAGNVGAEAAREMLARDLGDVWMLDIVEGMPQGKALDMSHAASIVEHSVFAYGTNSYDDIRDADVVVLTAGVARKPGMTREDLLNTNLKIVKSCCEEIKRVAPNTILIVVTNPLDAMVYTAYKVTNFPRHRIMGMAGVLDSTRFRAFIAMELGVSPEDVHAMVLGTHGDLMVPLPRYANVAGIPITELLPQDKIEAIVNRTRKAGTEIVSLLKTGSAYYAPGAACAVMVESIVRDLKRVVAASVWLEGEYGISNVFAGVPIILGEKGIEKVIEVKLTDDELALLKRSAEHVEKLQKEVDEKLANL